MTAVQTVTTQRSKPGRPSKAESTLMDARILDAAWLLFSENGYDQTSMEAIADRAGVTRMTLYQRHKDKLSLFRAVITNRGEAWGKVAQRIDWLKGNSLEERMKNYARQMLRWSQDSEISANRRLSEGMRGEAGPLAYELEQSFRRQIADLLAEDITKQAARDRIALRNPRELAAMLIGLLETVIGEAQREGHDLNWMISSGLRAVDIMICGKAAW